MKFGVGNIYIYNIYIYIMTPCYIQDEGISKQKFLAGAVFIHKTN